MRASDLTKAQSILDDRTTTESTLMLLQGGEDILEYGDVVVAERGDGDIKLATGTCILITEPPA